MFGRDILNIFKCSITYMAITSFKSGKLRLKFILFIFFFSEQFTKPSYPRSSFW